MLIKKADTKENEMTTTKYRS